MGLFNGRRIGKVYNAQQGAIAVIFALVLPAIIAIMGLAIDFGYLYVMRSKLQDVADATALAGAMQMHKTEGRYHGSPVAEDREALVIGKAIADFVSVNDAVFRNVTIDNVVYKGFYRTYENGYVNEEKVDINDNSNSFVKLVDFDCWSNSEKGPKLAADMNYKVEYAISGRLNSNNFLDVNVDSSNRIISDYIDDDRVRVRLSKRVPLMFLNAILGDDASKGVVLTVTAAAKGSLKDIPKPMETKSPTVYSLGGSIDLNNCPDNSIIYNGSVDFCGNTGAAPLERNLLSKGCYITTAANHVEFANNVEKFAALGNNAHVYAVGRTTSNDPKTSIETTGSYIVIKQTTDGSVIGVDLTASYVADDSKPLDFSKNTPFYEVVIPGYTIDSSSYKLVTDKQVIGNLRSIIDHAKDTEVSSYNSSLDTTANRYYWDTKAIANSFTAESVKNAYRNSEGNKRYLTNNTEKWEAGGMKTTVNNVVKNWNDEVDSKGMELYVDANDGTALAKGFVDTNNSAYFSNGPWVPILTDFNLEYSNGTKHVSKINSTYFSGGAIIATTNVTYGDIYCNGPLYISGENNVFNGRILATELYVLGQGNKMYTDSSYENVGMFASNVYFAKGPIVDVGIDSTGHKYIKASQIAYTLPENYNFTLNIGWGAAGLLDESSALDGSSITSVLVE